MNKQAQIKLLEFKCSGLWLFFRKAIQEKFNKNINLNNKHVVVSLWFNHQISNFTICDLISGRFALDYFGRFPKIEQLNENNFTFYVGRLDTSYHLFRPFNIEWMNEHWCKKKSVFLKIPFYKNFEEDLFSSARSSQLFDVASMLSRLMLFKVFSETKKLIF